MALVNPMHSLSFKLIRAVMLIGFVVGLMISALQIYLDYGQQKKLMLEDMQNLSTVVKTPATALLFSLDQATANQLLVGVLKHPGVNACKLILNEGTVFAEQTMALMAPQQRQLSDLLFGQTMTQHWNLVWQFSDHKETLGQLAITTDTYYYGQSFLERAWITLASTMLFALVLTAVFLGLFYLMVTQPLVSVIQSIKQVDVDAPEKTRLVEPSGHEQDEIGLLTQLTNQHLEAMSNHLSFVKTAEEQMQVYSESLEVTVLERTQALTQSINQLKSAQTQLIESEKLAALGGLVAGVAHEVNTPLGVAVTAASVLEETLLAMQTQLNDETMTEDSLKALIQTSIDSQSMLSSNLNRATRLIKDFKMTAVDQLSEKCCEFYVYEVIHALIESLVPVTKKVPVTVQLECPAALTMVSLPGVLTQVLSNLIMNSIRHAFELILEPQISITVREDEGTIIVDYRDNGVGVPKALHERIFEPFFTTKRGKGGSGLGLNIVYNLVLRKLAGRLEFESAPGQGMHFTFYLPATVLMDMEP